MDNKLFKRFISLFLFFAFVISTLTPFFAVYNLEPENKAIVELSKIFGGKILICSSDGFKWVNVVDLENENKHAPNNNYKCPLCYIAANVPSVLLSGAGGKIVSQHSDVHVQVIYFTYEFILLPANNTVNIQTRAPPLSFAT